MNVDTDSFDCRDLPLFLAWYPAAFVLPSDYVLGSAARFMKCSEPLARQNYERLHRINLYANLTPAILAYEGIQYQYMAPGVLPMGTGIYSGTLENSVRFYGLLCPFDGVAPYRLEMQAKLAVDGAADLYAFGQTPWRLL